MTEVKEILSKKLPLEIIFEDCQSIYFKIRGLFEYEFGICRNLDGTYNGNCWDMFNTNMYEYNCACQGAPMGSCHAKPLDFVIDKIFKDAMRLLEEQ